MTEKSQDQNEEQPKKNNSIGQKEQETLEFWQENGIFEKSLEKNEDAESFVFYDGPPFATGLPHYGGILQSIIKDAVPRYQTMRGKHVRRVWGWDCHGLPIENLIEGELGLESKKDIEEYGIANFNERARESVFRYEQEWRKIIPRFGRWIDMDHPYQTMDPEYTESVWWAFAELFKKGFIYEGHKAMHICPRCETTLANSEVTLNYEEVKDLSVTAKFELVDDPGTFLLAWTTTAWTLPGNVALAVNPEMEYVKVSSEGERYVVAKELAESVFEGKDYEVLESMKGVDLVGKSYEPLFEYYSADESLENRENGWQVYSADFVSAEGGTGIVHIAPAFGEDDLELGKNEKLPFVQHVNMNGTFKPEVSDFSGMKIKTKGDTQSADIEIIKKLARGEKLFAKEKITHSYPLCWRCDTPLLNYAASSWFVAVTEIKDKLLSENEEISWVPEHLKHGRFGKWLEGARDWAISRSRYWGAPIPVWKCEECGELEVASSVKDIQKKASPYESSYYVMRHGEAENNRDQVIAGRLSEDSAHLTDNGKEEALREAKDLKNKNIDVIAASPFYRTRETAEIIAGELGLSKDQIIFDERIGETDGGVFEGRPIDEYHDFFENPAERFTRAPEDGESWNDVKKRMLDFLFELDGRARGKNVLIITHQSPARMLISGARGMSQEQMLEEGDPVYLDNAEVHELSFVPFSHNTDYELDLHRPYIDAMTFACECGGTMSRVPEVFDCWFESGSMPYAQFHYPFENEELFERNFPANFIAEGMDQTRGWFYNMLVLSVGLFGKRAFENVVTTGLVLAEDGQKMSKRLKNYPDPMEMAERYGADAVRYAMLSSPVVRGQELHFSEKGVDEVYKKVIGRLNNVVSFYEMYAQESDRATKAQDSEHILDKWILARQAQLLEEVQKNIENYELDRTVRPLGEFVDDLSTWYLRRSRERFKGDDKKDKDFALATLQHILLEFSKVAAPFLPFFTEDIYARVGGEKESVHLEQYPEAGESEEGVLSDMAKTRELVSAGLEARSDVGIKVRQPLATMSIKDNSLEGKDELLALVKDEVNVKAVSFDAQLESELELDTELSDELREEGELRELLRTLQELRKASDLNVGEEAVLLVRANEAGQRFLERFETEIKEAASLSSISPSESLDEPSKSLTLGEKEFSFEV